MSAANAIAAIQKITTVDELNQVIESVKLRQTWIARQATRTFRLNDKVKFDGGQRKGIISGKVVKVNRKTIVVDAGVLGRWRVNASMLEAA